MLLKTGMDLRDKLVRFACDNRAGTQPLSRFEIFPSFPLICGNLVKFKKGESNSRRPVTPPHPPLLLAILQTPAYAILPFTVLAALYQPFRPAECGGERTTVSQAVCIR